MGLRHLTCDGCTDHTIAYDSDSIDPDALRDGHGVLHDCPICHPEIDEDDDY